jgi:hypothetical protein
LSDSGTGDLALSVLKNLGGAGGGYTSLIERLNREGEAISANAVSAFTTFATPTGAGAACPGTPVPGPGRSIYLRTASLWASTPIRARLQVQGGSSAWPGTGTVPLQELSVGCGPTLACPPILIDAYVRSSDRSGLGVGYVTGWLDPAVAGTHYVGCTYTAYSLADSVNFDAKKVLLMLGDSTWNGVGPSEVAP